MPETTNLHYATHGGVTVARITVPTISERECPGLLFDLSAAAQGSGGRLVLDLSEVLMITSAGLGMFVNLRKACIAAGPKGKVVLCNVSEDITRLLAITKFNKLFAVTNGADAALAEFK